LRINPHFWIGIDHFLVASLKAKYTDFSIASPPIPRSKRFQKPALHLPFQSPYLLPLFFFNPFPLEPAFASFR